MKSEKNVGRKISYVVHFWFKVMTVEDKLLILQL